MSTDKKPVWVMFPALYMQVNAALAERGVLDRRVLGEEGGVDVLACEYVALCVSTDSPHKFNLYDDFVEETVEMFLRYWECKQTQ